MRQILDFWSSEIKCCYLKPLGLWWVVNNSRQFSSVQSLSCVWLFATPWMAAHQASLSITNSWSWHESNSCLLSQWCHPTILSSVVPFSSCPQSFPASGSFQMSQFFESGDQSVGASGSASVLPMNLQDWFPLGWTGWISLQSKGLSRAEGSQHYNLVLFFVNTSWILSPVFLIINTIISFLIFKVIFIYSYYTSNTHVCVLNWVSHVWLLVTP